jgi:hypothetical protein
MNPISSRCSIAHSRVGVNRKRLNITDHYPKSASRCAGFAWCAYRWRALRIRVMVRYVLRRSRTTAISVRVAQSVNSGAMRKVVLSPARPVGLPAAARTTLLLMPQQPRFPSAPMVNRRLPKTKTTPYHQHQLSVDYAAPRIGLTTASAGIVAQYTAHSTISAARLANCDPR